ACETGRRKNNVGKQQNGERINGNTVLIGKIESLVDIRYLKAAVMARVARARFIHNVWRDDVGVIQDRADGVIDIVCPAANETREVSGVHVGLQRSRKPAEESVLLRELVVNADIILVAVERLTCDEQKVAGLRAGRSDIRRGQQGKRRYGSGVDLRHRNLIVWERRAGDDPVGAGSGRPRTWYLRPVA